MTLLTELAPAATCYEHENRFRCRAAALRVLVAHLLDDLRTDGNGWVAVPVEVVLDGLDEVLLRLGAKGGEDA